MSVKNKAVRSAVVCSLALVLTACNNTPPPALPASSRTPPKMTLSPAAEQNIKAIQNAPNLTDQQKQEAIARLQSNVSIAPTKE